MPCVYLAVEPSESLRNVENERILSGEAYPCQRGALEGVSLELVALVEARKIVKGALELSEDALRDLSRAALVTEFRQLPRHTVVQLVDEVRRVTAVSAAGAVETGVRLISAGRRVRLRSASQADYRRSGARAGNPSIQHSRGLDTPRGLNYLGHPPRELKQKRSRVRQIYMRTGNLEPRLRRKLSLERGASTRTSAR